jgi:phage tail-like protein
MLDVNGTRYHLVFGPPDWPHFQSVEDRPRPTWEYDPNHNWVQLQAEPYQFIQQRQGSKVLNRRGSARDAYGHWYWISENGQKIIAQWAAAKQAVELYPDSPASSSPAAQGGDFHPVAPNVPNEPETLSGLALMDDGYLVTGVPRTNCLLAFDLYALDGGFIEVPLPSPEDAAPATPEQDIVSTERFVLATLPQGGLLVLDRAFKRVWQLGASLQPLQITEEIPGERMTFQPPPGGLERRYPSQTYSQPVDIRETHDPVAIAPLPDGSFWLLDRGAGEASVLWFYSQAHNFEHLSVELLTRNLIEPEADELNIKQIKGCDFAYLPGPDDQGQALPKGQLFIVDPSGSQVYGLVVESLPDKASPWSDINREASLQLRLQRGDYYPLRYFAGTGLIGDWQEGKVYYQQDHHGTRWLSLQPLPKQRYEKRADLLLPDSVQGFDGREPGCVWHRLCVDAQIPPGTSLMVEARAADTAQNLKWQPWQNQPTLYRRPLGSEIPYSNLWSQEELNQSYTGTWELLFQQTQGRFLQIRLTLVGNGLCTPKLRALRAHYPRFSYLKQYLPAVYQQDRDSMQFLENFLANPEGLFTTAEGMIAQMQYLIDVRTVPEDALDWLASWLGLLLQPAWTDYQRRLLMAHTPYFFQRRGTLPGVMQAVLLTVYPELGPKIFQDTVNQLTTTVRIVEHFLTRTRPGVAVGDPSEQEISASGNVQEDARVRAHRFTVMLPTTVSPETLGLVERIVELEKPAHTAFTLKQYWRFFRVGEVRLGLETVLELGSRAEMFRLGQTALAEGELGLPFPYNLTNRTVIPQQTRR